MINQSMMPIFNKISDLFKSKVYVDSGPLEQNNHKIQTKSHSDRQHNQDIPHTQNYKQKNLYANESENILATNIKENFDRSEEEDSIFKKNHHDITQIPNTHIYKHVDISENLKVEFNVNKILFYYLQRLQFGMKSSNMSLN